MSAYLDWHVGMKVVCLQGVTAARGSVSNRRERVGTADNANYPEQSAVYTVRHINAIDDDYVLILLEEVRNDHLKSFLRCGFEPGFDARHFRPVAKRTTSIEIFRALLNPSDADTFRELEAAEFDYEPTEVPFR